MDKPKRSEFRPARERTQANIAAKANAFAHRASAASVDAWFARLDALNDEPFMPEAREQPPMPIDAADGDT